MQVINIYQTLVDEFGLPALESIWHSHYLAGKSLAEMREALSRRPLKRNYKTKNGAFSLSSDYLDYRREGGNLSPEAWNDSLVDLKINKS